MKRRLISVAGVALLAIGAGAASAHHSFAMFDRAQQVTLEGTVKEFQWTNPHTWTQLIVTQDGKQVEYGIEGGSPNGLSRRGWSKNSLKAGERVKIVINPLKDGQKGGSFVRATFPDGRTLIGQ
jgi:hypothetical protein